MSWAPSSRRARRRANCSTNTGWALIPMAGLLLLTAFAPPDAASDCATGGDGLESSPLAASASGWWTGVLVRARAFGVVELQHADRPERDPRSDRARRGRPAHLGEGNAADWRLARHRCDRDSTDSDRDSVRIQHHLPGNYRCQRLHDLPFGAAVCHHRCAGRWTARLYLPGRALYADSIQPAGTSTNGGQITIRGSGFRAGNEVLVTAWPQ